MAPAMRMGSSFLAPFPFDAGPGLSCEPLHLPWGTGVLGQVTRLVTPVCAETSRCQRLCGQGRFSGSFHRREPGLSLLLIHLSCDFLSTSGYNKRDTACGQNLRKHKSLQNNTRACDPERTTFNVLNYCNNLEI